MILAFLLLAIFFFYPQLVQAASPSDIVINEVYYDVDSSHGVETTNEWIELYNKTDSAIDISNWTIADNSSTKTVPSSSSIPAKGIALISPDSSTWNFWSLDSSVIKINMALGNGLSNTGDKLTLKDTSSNVIDTLSYGTNIDVWNPALPDVDEGHSLERNPGGKDTDSTSDFIDQESPTPGRTISQAIPSPSPSPSPTPTSTAAPKSPSPTTSASKLLQASPSPTNKPEVLAASSSIQSSPQTFAQNTTQEKSQNTILNPRILLIITGLGAVLIGLSIGLYLWYSRKLQTKNDQGEKNDSSI